MSTHDSQIARPRPMCPLGLVSALSGPCGFWTPLSPAPIGS